MCVKDLKKAVQATFSLIFGLKGYSYGIPVSSVRKLPEMGMSLGSQIKYYREFKGLSQEELGQAVGMTKWGIRHIENDEMRLVNLKLLDKIITFLDIKDKVKYDDPYIAFIINNPAAQIKAYRKKKNITMYHLSELLNTAYSTVKKWENGKCIISRKCYERLMNLINED